MDDRMIALLEAAGAEGFTALYIYWTLEYVTVWLLLGLCVWGARAIWKFVKENT